MTKFLLLLLALSLSACASLYNLKSPEVSVADVSLAGGNFLEQRFKLKLRVTNPNDRDIALEGLVFDVLVGDKSFARGISNTPTFLPKLGEALVEVEGTAQSISILRQLLDLTQRGGRLLYRIKGEVVTRDFGRIPFDRKSETGLPSISDKKGSETF